MYYFDQQGNQYQTQQKQGMNPMQMYNQYRQFGKGGQPGQGGGWDWLTNLFSSQGSGVMESSSPAMSEFSGAVGSAEGGSMGSSLGSGAASYVALPALYYGLAKLGGSVARNNFDDSTFMGQIGESLDRPLNVEQYWAKELGMPEWFNNYVLDVMNPVSVVERVLSDVLGI